MYRVVTKVVAEVNCDVLVKLQKCLHFQIRNNCVQRSLIKCLVTILNETETVLDDDLKDEILGYIFMMEYKENPDFNCIAEVITMALNNSMNSQEPDESIFRQMGDPFHKTFPKTCHLL